MDVQSLNQIIRVAISGRPPTATNSHPQNNETMERMKYIEVRTVGQNDCTECIFSLKCINPCRLPSGYHYEENKR